MNYMKYIFQLILQGIIWKFADSVLQWEVTHHKLNVNWDDADAVCKANGQVLAVVDSEEKWEKVKNVITGGNRYTAEADVYIGLTFTANINNFTWSTGARASWTKWFENEPYYTDTRHCVRLDVYANYYFRTTDCTYNHHFVCSYEVEVPDKIVDMLTTSSTTPMDNSGIKRDMIIGLSIGFAIFTGIGILICLMCRCCCTFPERKYNSKPTGGKVRPTRTVATSQYEIFMNQTDGFDYNRTTSSASANRSGLEHGYYDSHPTPAPAFDWNSKQAHKSYDNVFY